MGRVLDVLGELEKLGAVGGPARPPTRAPAREDAEEQPSQDTNLEEAIRALTEGFRPPPEPDADADGDEDVDPAEDADDDIAEAFEGEQPDWRRVLARVRTLQLEAANAAEKLNDLQKSIAELGKLFEVK